MRSLSQRTTAAFAPVLLATGCSIFGDFSGFSSGSLPPDGGTNGDGAAQISDAAAGADVVRQGSDGSTFLPTNFTDNFDRPNGPVGNGWLEKTNGVFSIANQKITATSGDWQRRVLYRPAEENVFDVEASVELSWTSVVPAENCDPAILLRIDTSSVMSPNAGVTAYAVFIDDTVGLIISRLRNGENVLENVGLPEPVNTTDSYRMTFRATGMNPVALDALFEKKSGSGWTKLRSLEATDGSNNQIKSAGSVGFTSDQHASFLFDGFVRTNL